MRPRLRSECLVASMPRRSATAGVQCADVATRGSPTRIAVQEVASPCDESCAAAILAAVADAKPAACAGSRVELTLDSSEARAVLAILQAQSQGTAISRGDWQRLFSSEPYVRLKRRELEDRGTIAQGKRADLVLLTADPTRDINNVRRIEAVMQAGVIHDPGQLRARAAATR